MYLVSTVLLLIVSIGSSLSTGTYTLDSCPIKLEPLGCYDDHHSPNRAMPDQIINMRGGGPNPGYILKWDNSYALTLERFMCDCARKAFMKGYRVIGMQFFGECWGSITGHLDYNKHGSSSDCVRPTPSTEASLTFHKCQRGDKLCTGQQLSNYVYRIAPTVCDTYYEPVGCYQDKQNVPRLLPELILTERDYTHHSYNGKLIDWKHWNSYSPAMLCRCATKASEKNYTTFSIQFYGECWSGKDNEIQYARGGTATGDRCIAKDFDPCVYNSYHCIGKAFTNRVYRLKNRPSNFKPYNQSPQSREAMFDLEEEL